jgi:DNA (cytosine-5)-methyltransferase 1
MDIPIPIIDIFAGPGGLGEGFSSLRSSEGKRIFKIRLSIEKDESAHQTLELRAFFRQFDDNARPVEYYDYLKEKISHDDLFQKYPVEASNAQKEAWLAELGKTENTEVDSRIRDALAGVTDWVLIGGPPCQAYSLIGRAKILGEDRKRKEEERTYETDNRHFLYKQYLRILAVHHPAVFVMENVKGLLSAEVKQKKTFDQILTDLQGPGKAIENSPDPSLTYKLFSISHNHSNNGDKTNPKDYIVRSEEYGIPQSRHRIIIVGIRSDFFRYCPEVLVKQASVPIENVIGDLPRLRSGLSKKDSEEKWRNSILSIAKADWFESLVPELRDSMEKELKNIGKDLPRGNAFQSAAVSPLAYHKWYFDSALGGLCHHESRTHMQSDLHRYFFAAVYGKVKGCSPYLSDFPKELLPNHTNASDGSKFTDRFRVQISGRPSTTVVSHISQDGHYYIHYDPAQCRSLTVREAARLQTFPDNYFFQGNKTQQYNQVGNAVPPLLAQKIAEIVAKLFFGIG